MLQFTFTSKHGYGQFKAVVFNFNYFGPPSSLAPSLNYHFKLTGLLDLHKFFLTHLTVKRTMQEKYQQALGN